MRKLLTLFCLLNVSFAFAQSQALYFRNLNTDNGLSNNKVNCILQDRRGFMWIGTDDGLNRYDGFRFEVYRHDAAVPSTISGNIITDLLEDKDGVIWIATADGGLTRFDYRKSPAEKFRQFKHKSSDSSSIPGNIVNSILEDKLGYLWLATSGQGIIRFNKSKEIFDEPVRSRSRTVLDLELDHLGRIWAGRQGGGMITIDPHNFKTEEDARYGNVYAKLPHMAVATIFRDSRNMLWLGSWDKVIYQLNPVNKTETVITPENQPGSYDGDDPLSFAEDSRQQLWIGGKRNGLHVYNYNTGTFKHYKHDPAAEGTIAGNIVYKVYIDRSGMIWLGTNKGLSIHDPSDQQFTQQFLPAEKDENIAVYDVMNNNSESLWLGTSMGIYEMNRDGQFRNIPMQFNGEALHITNFLQPDENTLFLGSQVSLFLFSKENGKLQRLPNTEKDVVMNRIIESRVVSMMMDTLDNHPVLITLPYGHYLTYYDFTLKQWVNRQDSIRRIISRYNIRDNLLRKLYKTSDGKIWVATSKMGLGEWQRGVDPKFHYYINNPGDEKSISNNNVYDIAEDRYGNLWISTYGGGLHYFDLRTRSFQHIRNSDNLTEGLRIDLSGNVWVIANGNLHKYDPVQKTYTSFHLPDIEKSGGVQGQIFAGKNGKMIVAGTNYIIAFHPDSIREANVQPKVFLTDFSIFNESNNQRLYEKEIELNYNQNFFTLAFSAPSFQAGKPVHYAHKLEGVDEDWVEDGTRNTVNYTNLDGGHYRFMVKASVKPGIWSTETTIIPIRINPPYWKTFWFYAICAAFVSFAIYGIYLYRINEIIRRQDIRNKIAQDLHDNVGSTLSSISVYSQVAKIYKQQQKQDQLQDTLEKISSTSSEMISEMNDIVWAINPRNDNMETILQRMDSFARPLLVTKDIFFHFDFDPDVKHLNLEMTKRKNFYLIFKEAINNILKYSEAQNVWVEVRHDRDLELTVKDDGKGMDLNRPTQANPMSGNGLQNMYRRAAEMKGVCMIDSGPGQGMTIKLRFSIP
ncbi:sensor histidine kinase [Pollutibacter soli]|uniref:sensor histidine kinase n=1 Tax=Pollutibacter soli TaxID=3034157 RepID=UPI0030135359